MQKVMSVVAQRVLLLVLVVAAWDLLAVLLDSRSVPRVEPVLDAAREAVVRDTFWSAIAGTMQSWVIGMSIAAAIGVPVGLLIGASDLATRLTRGLVEILRTVPAIMLVPLVVLLFGATVQMKVFLIAISAVWPILVQASYGIRQVDAVARDSARVFRLGMRLRVRFLYLPTALPFVATGVRVAATVALLISIGAEIVTSAPGIGHEILLSQANNNGARAFVFVLLSGLLGILINQSFGALERKTMFWHASQRIRVAS
jgi:ABC-type nitrate/sulfonate/bicarbonate transport system permease component